MILSSFFSPVKQSPTQKIFFTLLILFFFRLGNTIPLTGIDQEALKKSFLQFETRNALMQILSMYSGSGVNGGTLLSPFSLGIIPYINASILIDLLTAIFPTLEKLQSEEGEAGRQKLTFYKKIVTLLFSILQSGFLLFYLQSYFYNPSSFHFFLLGSELVTGAMIIVWLSQLIDKKGIGNGTSLIIFTNIVMTLLNKNFLAIFNQNSFFVFEIGFLFFLFFLICISQITRIQVEVVSARQLAFLEKIEKNSFTNKVSKNFQFQENGLSIRLNQAGIFPIIIASNLLPFFSFLPFLQEKSISSIIYYCLIICFNYFYTIVFWDPEKIAEQLRKASVSIVNVTPGAETVSYLGNMVKASSILGGLFLCLILFLFDLVKQVSNSPFLNQFQISSLIILVGVAYELQKTVRSLYKNVIE